MSEHELIRSDLTPFELPTEGEWKRACTDRKVLEQAFREYVPNPNSDTITIGHPLRGERFVAVPSGAVGVTFHFHIPDKATN